MTVFDRHDRVLVVDVDDPYIGMHGVVLAVKPGLLTGADIVEVQLEGRKDWDVEGFYTDQLILERDAVTA